MALDQLLKEISDCVSFTLILIYLTIDTFLNASENKILLEM